MLHLQPREELRSCRLWRMLFLLQLLQEKRGNDRRREANNCKGNGELSLKLLDRQPVLRILLNNDPMGSPGTVYQIHRSV